MQHLEGSGTPVLYIGRTVLKVNTTAIRRKTVRCLGTFKQSNSLSCIGSNGKEKCFHVVCLQVMLQL
jgi:hypothetical protein